MNLPIDDQTAFFALVQTIIVGVVTIIGYLFRKRAIRAEAKLIEAQVSQVNADAQSQLIENIKEFSILIREERQESRAMNTRIRELEEAARTERKSLQEQVDALKKNLSEAETRQTQAIADLRDQHTAEIKAITKKHTSEIQGLRDELKQSHENEVNSLKTNHRDELVRLEVNHGNLVQELREQLAKANEQIAFLTGELANLKEQVRVHHDESIENNHKNPVADGVAGESGNDPSIEVASGV